MNTSLYDTILVFEAVSLWRVALCVVVVTTVLVLAYRGLRGELQRSKRWMLLSLRAISLVLLSMLFLEPSLQDRRLSEVARKLVLLVDTSRSMSLDSGQGINRAAVVRRMLKFNKDELERLEDRFNLGVYSFDTHIHSTILSDVASDTEGDGTDIISAIEQIVGIEKKDLAGIILVSDGIDTASMRDVPSSAHDLSDEVKKRLENIPVPVNTISVGSSKGYRDIAISSVSSDSIAFIRNAVNVKVHIKATGFDEISVPVVMETEGRHLAATTVKIGDDGIGEADLKFVPDRVGKFAYRISTPVQQGEVVAENNSRIFITRIIRDKIRILHVVGRPSWDVRFVRQVLKKNPNIDLISFYILRTLSDTPGVGQDALSLIPFPVEELFGSELPTFDVVIFQNFNHGPYKVTYFLPQIASYINNGGAFLMIGGDLSFGAGGYAGSALENILPVRLFGNNDVRQQEFRPVVTKVGQDHPVMDLGYGFSPESMPPLGDFNMAAGVDTDAVVLMAHPFERCSGVRCPILALKKVGRGRSVSLLTASLWRWGFEPPTKGTNPKVFNHLLNNIILWLIDDPSMEAVNVWSQRSEYNSSEPVMLELRSGDGKYEKLQLSVWNVDNGKIVERKSMSPGASGKSVVQLGMNQPGSYGVKLEALQDGKVIATAQDSFSISGHGVEMAQTVPRPDILQQIASITGGDAVDYANPSFASPKVDEKQKYRVDASSSRPLIAHWWMLLLLGLLWGTEWFLRRRWGLA